MQLYRRKAWTELLRTWPRLHQQHDVAELLTYIVDHANVPGLKGIWEARSMEGPLPRAHQRMQPVPLIMLPCKPNKTLQQLIEDWAYEQDTGHRAALVKPPMHVSDTGLKACADVEVRSQSKRRSTGHGESITP